MSRTLTPKDIPGLSYLCGDPTPDSRIKVIWLEDKIELDIALQAQSYVHVTRLKVPEAAERLLELTRADSFATQRGPVYTLAGPPHDVYIADHRLDEAPTNEVGLPTLARQAEAAGLTTAILMALNFPAHPATVSPYTAHEEQIRSQRDLLQRLIPKNINVTWTNNVSKLELGTEKVLNDALKAHRDFMPIAAGWGTLHLRVPERERVRSEIDECLEKRQSWPEFRQITLETKWGARRILLGALWPEIFEHEEDEPLAEALHAKVVAWLDGFPTPTHEEKTAGKLAWEYFQLRTSERSQMRYEFADLVREGTDLLDGTDNAKRLRELSGQIGLDIQGVRVAVQAEKEGGVAPELVIPPDWTKPHLFATAKEMHLPRSTRRLAVLFLFVYEAAMRASLHDYFASDAEESSNGKTRSSPRFDINAAAKCHEGLKVIQLGGDVGWAEKRANKEFLRKLYEDHDAMERWNIYSRMVPVWNLTLPMTTRYVPRLLDPLPKKAGTCDADFGPSHLGKALYRIGFKDIGALLAPGNEAQLSQAERTAMQRFARDLAFEEAMWPQWMR
jgi:hypothetical protein